MPAALVILTELCSGFVMAKVNSQGAPSVVFWSCSHRYCGAVAVCAISRKLHGVTKPLPLECLYVVQKKVVTVLSSLHSCVARSFPKSLAYPCIGHK